MKKIRILAVLFISVLFASCLKDKSNYDYADMKEILVRFENSLIYTTPGEVVAVVPKLTYSSSVVDRDKLPKPEVTYEWYFDNQPVSTDSVLQLTAGDEFGRISGYLKVRNVATGEIYAGDYTLIVESPYKTGFLVLYENENGQGELGMIRSVIKETYNEENDDFDSLVYVSDYKDLYFAANQRPMNENAAYIKEHSLSNMNYGSLPTEITLGTKNGTSIEDLNGESFARETLITDEFDNGVLPDNFTPKMVVHTAIDSYVISTDNWMYNRRSADIEAYHTGKFYAAMPHNNVKYTDVFFTNHNQTNVIMAVELNAEGKRNYVGMYCQNASKPRNNGKSLPIIPSGSLSEEDQVKFMADVTDIKEEIVSMDFCLKNVAYDRMANCALVKKENKYYIHFTSYLTSEQRLTLEDSRMIDLSAHTGNRPILGMSTSKVASHVYFYTDQAVYIYDYTANAILTTPLFEVSDKKITALGAFNKTRNYTFYGPRAPLPSIAVGYDNGTIEVYELKRDGLAATSKLVYTSGKFGKIKQIIYKLGTSEEFYCDFGY